MDEKLYPMTKICVEQEPGSGGKESVEATIRMLAGFVAEADRVTGSKEVRADPFAAQWQAGSDCVGARTGARDTTCCWQLSPVSRFKPVHSPQHYGHAFRNG